MLGTFPSRYQVSKAFVLDSDGNLSHEIDAVVHDRHYSPLLVKHEGATYIPAESVYAVFEIKQELSKETMEYAAEKIASVRRLVRTSIPIVHAGGVYEAKEPSPILGGILCFEATWNPPFGDPFKALLGAAAVEKQLDLGCVLRHGAFDVTYKAGAEPEVELSAKETALASFMLHFLHRLQQLGTVPALDLKKYARGL